MPATKKETRKKEYKKKTEKWSKRQRECHKKAIKTMVMEEKMGKDKDRRRGKGTAGNRDTWRRRRKQRGRQRQEWVSLPFSFQPSLLLPTVQLSWVTFLSDLAVSHLYRSVCVAGYCVHCNCYRMWPTVLQLQRNMWSHRGLQVESGLTHSHSQLIMYSSLIKIPHNHFKCKTFL